ncbi:hypothetical protein H1164_08465 [Thermoactinomyces daqus]|uniref:DNA-directed DNA polymerase n=1 Tax=Thermoactinomyces daqus TaxID=1329516 RepID=A0A7W1XAD7_9BACL|nr:DNA polymerase [Thermoactinomyces daqus]MBA4542934.1 hypothetical protein [Thermoactinomyces daqus]
MNTHYNFVNDSNFLDIVRYLVTDERKVQKGTNLQNLPSKGDGELVRKCFIPPEGYVIIGADLSSIEPRIQAEILWTEYQDDSMIKAYWNDEDPYVDVALIVFKFLYPELKREWCQDKCWFDPVSRDGGTKKDEKPATAFEPRKLAKQGMLAVAYRQSAKGFAESMGVPIEVGEHFIKKFNELYPKFEQMVAETILFMQINGYVPTLFGRKRRFPEYKILKREIAMNEDKLTKLYRERKKLLNKEGKPTYKEQQRFKQIQKEINEIRQLIGKLKRFERQAFNHRIQGTGADILKQNGNRMGKICIEKGDWFLPASIHDELLMMVPEKDVTPETIALIEDVMCNTVKLNVPLKTDIVIMNRWMEEISPEEWFAGKRTV